MLAIHPPYSEVEANDVGEISASGVATPLISCMHIRPSPTVAAKPLRVLIRAQVCV